ncbi:MAG: hypothetical protein F4Y50_08335 [Dehalococcoidia bacterium]|nr:hypothetical protein [Dehalococcoidia bacterium]
MHPRNRDVHDRAVEMIARERYGAKIMGNIERAAYVEAIIYIALSDAAEDEWRATPLWEAWDLENRNGVRVEVKQSAARQPWRQDKPSKPTFSISKQVSDLWDYDNGNHIRLPSPMRVADIYVFAWHSEERSRWVDHRALAQWRFYVVAVHRLPPDQMSISLNPLKALADPVGYNTLPHAIDEAARSLTHLKCDEMKTLGE